MTDFNDQKVRKPYEGFYGQYREQMPLLMADNRVLVSVANVMERRLNSINPAWKSNYVGTCDAIAYKGNKVKISLDEPTLRGLTAQTPLRGGALMLAEGAYEAIKGPEFTRKELAELCDRDLTQAQVIAHPIWQTLARDPAVLQEYVGRMFPEMKKQFGYNTAMGFFLDDQRGAPKMLAKIRVVYVDGLVNKSLAISYMDLDNENGYLVGVAPEMLNVPDKVIVQPSLEQTLRVINGKPLE